MFSYFEILGERSGSHPRGEVEFTAEHTNQRQPAWLVALKALGSLVLIAVSYALLVPMFLHWLPLGKTLLLTTGVLFLYIGLAFVVRPRPNLDNLGWGYGLIDDPTQYSDDINRGLIELHMFFGPGRFLAETAIAVGTLFGLVAETSPPPVLTADDYANPESPRLSPDRFDRPRRIA